MTVTELEGAEPGPYGAVQHCGEELLFSLPPWPPSGSRSGAVHHPRTGLLAKEYLAKLITADSGSIKGSGNTKSFESQNNSKN